MLCKTFHHQSYIVSSFIPPPLSSLSHGAIGPLSAAAAASDPSVPPPPPPPAANERCCLITRHKYVERTMAGGVDEACLMGERLVEESEL